MTSGLMGHLMLLKLTVQTGRDLPNVVSAYSDRLNLVSQGSEIMSGVNAVAIPGHTPGHSGFRVDDGNDSLMHLGDIIHVANLQLITQTFPWFLMLTVKLLWHHARVLDMVSADNILCTSGHWLSPKFGHIERHGNGFAATSRDVVLLL